MANRNFNEWLSGFRDSIAEYGTTLISRKSIVMSMALRLN